jgi:hypothetical protein
LTTRTRQSVTWSLEVEWSLSIERAISPQGSGEGGTSDNRRTSSVFIRLLSEGRENARSTED